MLDVLGRLDSERLARAEIGFGGGTRIAIDIDEYRESVDIDLFCPSIESYRFVRACVRSDTLGALARESLDLVREVRMDRYGVRCAVASPAGPIQMEFLCFSDWALDIEAHPRIPVPVIDRAGCFATKLTAVVDRGRSPPFKDVFDLLAMTHAWGPAPARAVAEAERHYGPGTMAAVRRAIDAFFALPEARRASEAEALGVLPETFERYFARAHALRSRAPHQGNRPGPGGQRPA